MAPADCKSVLRAAWGDLILKILPSRPIRKPLDFTAASIDSLSFFKAGVLARKDLLRFAPSLDVPPTMLPIFSSPAPYR